MDLRRNNQNRSDDKETQYIPAQAPVKRSTDGYDTQELSAAEIRRQAQQGGASAQRQSPNASQPGARPYPQSGGYAQNGYGNVPPQPGARPYPQSGGYTQNGYGNVPPQPGVRPYPQSGGYAQNGYGNVPPQPGARPYPQSGGYAQNGYGNVPPQPGARPYPQSGGYAQNGYGNAPSQPGARPYPQSGGYSNAQSSHRPPSGVQGQGQRPVKKKRSGTPFWQKLLKGLLSVIIIVFLLYSAVALVGIFRANIVTTGVRSRTADAVTSSSVNNILVIGTDSRDIETDPGRSDSMILLSLNSETNTIYMTSFLRDVYVYISDEYGYGKLNAAYSYGGAELLMDTIESNYRVKIDDYVTISFAACSAMIDAVGGVEVTLSDAEAQALNEILISEVNELMGDGRNDDLLGGGGTYTLSGKQALSYSRIRYVGNADFERTSRQREVFSQVLQKASKNPVSLGAMMVNALPQVTTNISVPELYGYSLKAPYLLLAYDTAQQQIPAENTFYADTIGGESVLVADFTMNHNVLLSTIFNGEE